MILTISKIAIALQISTNLLLSICWVESRHQNAINIDDGGSPSYGICQVKLSTANFMRRKYNLGPKPLEAIDLMIPEINALYAGLYLKWQLQRYNNDIFCAISSYNAGSCTIRNKKSYVLKVRNRMGEL